MTPKQPIVDKNGQTIKIGDTICVDGRHYGPISGLGSNPPGNVFVGHKGFRGSKVIISERPRSGGTNERITMSETQDECSPASHCSQFVAGQQSALKYTLAWIESHTCGAIPRPAAYNAAMSDISIHVQAAMSRLEAGEPMESFSAVD